MKNEEGLNPGSIMQDLFGSVRRSLHFRPKLDPDESPNVISSVADRIGSCIRKSRVGLGGFLPKSPSTSSRRMTMGFLPKSPSKMGIQEEELPRIRWRKGELIGAGAFGQVFMGMNLDSGELLAVKQVMIESSNASKEKAQAHIRELEEEVKLLKNLSHPNIVRYLGTVREENTLNILLEFVPGGSISSLLSKFGSFPETVIRMYTKQILQGLEYLHRNKIIHRDIKGANILVDNKGCIKLADFGASKQVAQLATMAAAKSFKGTAYWMAPEVIVQSGYSFSADIWSVGCTVIEMVTGKPPWSGQYQEVAALFHVGTTKSHPPIPDHLSSEAKDFLLKCLQEDAGLRPSACDLLQHPFVTGEVNSEIKESSIDALATNKTHMSNNNFGTIMHSERRPIWETGTDDEMCRLDDEDDFPVVVSESLAFDDWPSKLGANINNNNSVINTSVNDSINGFKFPSEMSCEDDEEVTENTIRAFLDEKAIDLKKLQTPLYEEFYNSLNSSTAPFIITNNNDSKLPPFSPNRVLPTAPSLFRSGSSRVTTTNNNNNDSKLPPVSPNRIPPNGPGLFRLGSSRVVGNSPNMANSSRRVSHGIIGGGGRVLQEIAAPPQLNDLVMDSNDLPDPASPCLTISKKKETWREELKQELDMERAQREKMGPSRMTSPKDSPLSHKRNRPNNNTNKLENI